MEVFDPNSVPELVTSPNYLNVWDIERDFNLLEWRKAFARHWDASIHLSFIYLMGILVVKYLMLQRKPFELRTPLFLWNLTLAVFSMIGTVRLWPELIHVFKNDNTPWHSSVCSRKYHSVTSGFWTLLFVISKGPELVDTLFIVLRKQKLIFLHWYHHLTVLCYCWTTYYTYDSTATWFAAMNFFVHSLMYSYFALKAAKVSIPKSGAMGITLLQLLQMVIGVCCNIYALYAKNQGMGCGVTYRNIYLALGMYSTYFILFLNFFFETYFRKSTSNSSLKYGDAKKFIGKPSSTSNNNEFVSKVLKTE